jgi:WD40 repeat protein
MNFLKFNKIVFVALLILMLAHKNELKDAVASGSYNLVTQTNNSSLCLSDKYLGTVKLHPASGRIAIVNDEKVSIYDNNFNLITQFSEANLVPYEITWNPTGDLLAIHWIDVIVSELGGISRVGDLRIYDLSSLSIVKSVRYETQDIIAPIVWSPNGARIAVLLGDQIALITYPAMELIKLSQPDMYGVSGLVWNTSNPNQFATVSTDRSIRIWDITQTNPIRKISFQNNESLSGLAWKANDPYIAVGLSRDEERLIHVYHTETGLLQYVLTGHIGSVNHFDWTHPTLISGSSDGTIRIWDVGTGQSTRVINAGFDAISSVARNLDGSRIISSGADQVIRVWDIATGNLIQVKQGFHGTFYNISFSPDGTKVATTDHTSSFTTWSTVDGAYLHSYGNIPTGVASVSWSPDGSKIAAGGYDGKVYLWDSATQQLLSTFTINTQPSAVENIIWKSDSTQIAVMQGKDAITLWNVANGQIVRTLLGQGSSGFFSVLWSSDGTKLVTIGWDRKTLQLWDSTTGQELKKIIHGDRIYSIEWDVTSSQIIIGLSNKMEILNLTLQVQGAPLANSDEAPFTRLAWRNHLLLTIQQNGNEVILWDTDSRQVVSVRPASVPRTVKWLPTQNRFAIVQDRSICFYNNTRPDTPAIYRPSTTTFHFPTLPSVTFGNPNDHPITGDWNGDGVDTLGVFDPLAGRFQLRNSNTPGAPDLSFLYGNPGDIPLAGHWTATALHDGVGTYRNTNGTMYLFLRNQLTTGYADLTAIVGNPGDLPIVGDWNGDGVDTVGLYRPVSTTFYLFNRNAPDMEVETQFTLSGGVPIAGRWTGSGGAGVGFFADGVFSLKDTPESGAFDRTVNFGETGDLPLAGRWSP